MKDGSLSGLCINQSMLRRGKQIIARFMQLLRSLTRLQDIVGAGSRSFGLCVACAYFCRCYCLCVPARYGESCAWLKFPLVRNKSTNLYAPSIIGAFLMDSRIWEDFHLRRSPTMSFSQRQWAELDAPAWKECQVFGVQGHPANQNARSNWENMYSTTRKLSVIYSEFSADLFVSPV